MVAYNFQAQFASLVESGRKTQTIRRDSRKRHARPGEAIQLYTGQCTSQCRKLIDPDPICVRVRPIEICYPNQVSIGKKPLSEAELHQLARADGFITIQEFIAFFVAPTKGHDVFVGSLIEWESSSGDSR